MAGKICNGLTNNNAFRVGSTQACADGAEYRGSGTAVAKPKADNPHPVGSEDHDAWDAGWDLAHAAAGGNLAATGCLAPINGVLV